LKKVRLQKECIILFAKYPARGKVKTRLTPFLNKTQTLELYVSMLADTTGMLEKSGPDILVYCYPAGSVKAFRKFYGKGMDCRSQSGKGLGERMKNAFLNTFGSGYSRAVLVGCDIPGLSGRIIRAAFRGLKNKGITIGPAVDGGYYLIGFDRDSFLADIFTEIHWGSSSVFADTLKIIKENSRKAVILPELRDLDTIKDLVFFAGHKSRNSRVFQLIRRIFHGAALSHG